VNLGARITTGAAATDRGGAVVVVAVVVVVVGSVGGVGQLSVVGS
jgi:hypothetical protein